MVLIRKRAFIAFGVCLLLTVTFILEVGDQFKVTSTAKVMGTAHTKLAASLSEQAISNTSTANKDQNNWSGDLVIQSAVNTSNTTQLVKITTDIHTIDNPKHWIPDCLTGGRKTIPQKCLSTEKEALTKGGSLSLCTTAKGGSTFWKQVLRAKRRSGRKKTAESELVTFVVTRNPWHRLVSAWNDKLVMAWDRKFWIRVMCGGRTWDDHPTFRQFMEICVINKWRRNREFDNHWMPVIDRCKVCDNKIHIDLFIAAENVKVEGAYLLKKYDRSKNAEKEMDIARNISIRQTERKMATQSYQTQYMTIDKEQINILREIYKYEIYLFQYPDTPFVDFARA